MEAIAVTGALGNLGTKLLHHLASQGYAQLVGLDIREDKTAEAAIRKIASDAGHDVDVSIVACDLSDPHDDRWRSVVERVDGLVHYAAKNPFPEATWGEASVSLDMTVNTALGAAESERCRRYVFATSNHVMGRYRTANLSAGELTPDLDEGVGTVWHTGEKQMDSTPYATAKFAGERVCRGLAAQQNGTDYACVRIGWCQPGENVKETLSATGTPTQAGGGETPDPEIAATDRWFKGMWLSNRDMVHLFERALIAPSDAWPDGLALVNGMSDNDGMVWSLDRTRTLLGYEPQDNVFG